MCRNTFAVSYCYLKFENAQQCDRRMRKREVATQLYYVDEIDPCCLEIGLKPVLFIQLIKHVMCVRLQAKLTTIFKTVNKLPTWINFCTSFIFNKPSWIIS
jgi:hypothetical protein